jgi:hypothetical protein
VFAFQPAASGIEQEFAEARWTESSSVPGRAGTFDWSGDLFAEAD